MSVSKIVAAAASGVGGAGLDVDEVFSTFVADATGSGALTINNGIDLSGEGGIVWVKSRNNSHNHYIFDPNVGSGGYLIPNSNTVGLTGANYSFTSTGLTDTYNNYSNNEAVWWTFRKQPKFFDVVTYSSNQSSSQTINHNLGSVPGMIIVKRTSASANWAVYHRGSNGGTNPEEYALNLNTTGVQNQGTSFWNDTAPTSTQFTVGNNALTNDSDPADYVAYLFAHNNNDGGFGPDGDQDVIKCGSYTGDGTTDGSNKITLGFEPQWIFLKRSDGSGYYSQIIDSMRGMVSGGNDQILWPNVSSAENGTLNSVDATATGFSVNDSSNSNLNGSTWIYMAIRRGPLAAPTDATKVFGIDKYEDGSGDGPTNGIVNDFSLLKAVSGSGNWFATSRLQGANRMKADNTSAETSNSNAVHDRMDGVWNTNLNNYILWGWKRAPSYFDVVAYTGTGSARTVTHNLGVVPEMMWIKMRSSTQNWAVYHKGANGGTDPEDYALELNSTSAEFNTATYFNDTAPTSSVFTVGTGNAVNKSSETYIAYLFATVAGVSKVGSYTGDGTAGKVIDCGFSSGARFVLIKKSSDTGGWFVYDTERGIVSGNDPYLHLDSNNAENDQTDSIDPNSSGFAVNYSNTNANGQTYIFYAIA